MYSKFYYLKYDEIASEEQNDLRQKYIDLENQLLGEYYGNIKCLKPPQTEAYAKPFLEIRNSIDPKNGFVDSLTKLEMLYYLEGKDIREKLMRRIGIGQLLARFGINQVSSSEC